MSTEGREDPEHWPRLWVERQLGRRCRKRESSYLGGTPICEEEVVPTWGLQSCTATHVKEGLGVTARTPD